MNATNLKVSMQILSEKGHIDITWFEYERRNDFLRFDLVRKKASIPAHYFDGKVVYSGTDNEFSDTDIKNGSIYYYRLFVVINDGENYNTDYLTDARCIVKAIAFAANIVSYGDRLYKTLPDQVLEDDKRQEQEYPLKRFFRLLFTEFDKIEVINDAILDQLDVETCDESILPFHARWLGLEYDHNFDVATNRLLLGTWKEIQPYQGTETGVRYFLQKVFKSEVKITVDKKVNIVIITLIIDDTRYWMINSVDKINKMIKKYLALRTKYDLTIKLGPIEENFDNDRFDEYTFDIIWFAPDDEWYQNRDSGFNSEEALISYTLFFADKKKNRIKEEIKDFITMDLGASDEVYDLDAPLLLGSERFLLSHTMYFADRRVRDMDELFDKLKTDIAERYTHLNKDEKTLDVVRPKADEYYDPRNVISNEQYLLSYNLFFGDGNETKVKDELESKAIDQHSDVYDGSRPYLLSEPDSLIGEMMFSTFTKDMDKLYDSVIDVQNEIDGHNRVDNSLDILCVYDTDIYNRVSMFGDENALISSTMCFACQEHMVDEREDKGIVEDIEQYFIVMPNLMFCSGLLNHMTFGESTINPPDELGVDNLSDISGETYNKSIVDELGLTLVQDNIGNETIHSTGLFADDHSLMCMSFTFGRPESVWCDEVIDTAHYVRPVGLFGSSEALVGMSLFTCDNLI